MSGIVNLTKPKHNISATTQQYVNRLGRKNQAARERFENQWHRERAFLPVLMSNGRWLWGKIYWARYLAEVGKKRNPASKLDHYIRPNFIKGRAIERLDDKEMIIRKLKEC